MSSPTRFEHRDLEIGTINRELKLLAFELNIPIILLSQLSRGGNNVRTSAAHVRFKESGNIEQDADVIGFFE